jgi:hypothetical protein
MQIEKENVYSQIKLRLERSFEALKIFDRKPEIGKKNLLSR